MRQWKYTSYNEGRKTTTWGLSPFQAITAIERAAMHRSDPLPVEETPQAAPAPAPRQAVVAQKREPGTSEHLIPA